MAAGPLRYVRRLLPLQRFPDRASLDALLAPARLRGQSDRGVQRLRPWVRVVVIGDTANYRVETVTTDTREPSPFPAALSWILDNPISRIQAHRFIAGLGLLPGMRVLDYGCGPGRLTLPAARAVAEGGEVLAVDLQQEMLDRVKRRATAAGLWNVRTLKATAGEAALEPQSFDVALLSYVLGEIQSDRRLAALREIASALRKTGRLVVVEGGGDPHRQSVSIVRELGEQAGLRFDGVAGGWWTKVITLVPQSSP